MFFSSSLYVTCVKNSEYYQYGVSTLFCGKIHTCVTVIAVTLQVLDSYAPKCYINHLFPSL